MTQNDRWEEQYKAIVTFIRSNHRRPSKHKEEDMKMVNWIKYNQKLYNRDELKDDRRKKFETLMALNAKYRRINQYAYFPKEAGEPNK